MAKLSSKKSSTTSRVLVYGGPKTGKTLLAGKLAEHFNVIYIGMENGHETLFQLPEEWQSRVELVNLPDTRSYPIAIETVLKMVKGKVSICEDHGKVGCAICKRAIATDPASAEPMIDLDLLNLGKDSVVIFDSLTQLTNSAVSHITKGQPDDYKMQTDDWGNLGKLMDIFCSHVQQAPYNVVVISHETEAETEGKKKLLVPVAGTRNFSRNVAKYFDDIVYAERKNKKHVFASSTSYANTILTGGRSGVRLEDAGEDASLLQIFKPELYPGLPISSEGKQVSSKPTTAKSATRETSAEVLARLKKTKA